MKVKSALRSWMCAICHCMQHLASLYLAIGLIMQLLFLCLFSFAYPTLQNHPDIILVRPSDDSPEVLCFTHVLFYH